MNRFLLVLLVAPAVCFAELPAWQRDLSPETPGSFPLPRELKAHYRLGWMALGAGEADATFSRTQRGVVRLDVKGGTTGVVRTLWKLDATHTAAARVSTLLPIRLRQIENYGYKTVTTVVKFDDDSVSNLRSLNPPDPTPPAWQKFQFPDVRDLQTALLYVRSQRLRPGDDLDFVVFPANTPYLAHLHVICREKIQVKAGKYNALKVEVKLQRINRELHLEPHSKFKRAVAWISDDTDRMLLRAEADIFVGSVWAELQSVKYTPP